MKSFYICLLKRLQTKHYTCKDTLFLFMLACLLFQTVFEHIGDALAILITLDHILNTGEVIKNACHAVSDDHT